MSDCIYREFANAERKDALMPDPQEFDFTNPKKSKEGNDSLCKSVKERLDLFGRLRRSVKREERYLIICE